MGYEVFVTFDPHIKEDVMFIDHPWYGKIKLYNGIFIKKGEGVYTPVFLEYDFPEYSILRDGIRIYNTKYKKYVESIEIPNLNVRDILLAKLLTTSDDKIQLDVSYNKNFMLKTLNFLLKYMGISKKELSHTKLRKIMRVHNYPAVVIYENTPLPVSVVTSNDLYIISYESNKDNIIRLFKEIKTTISTPFGDSNADISKYLMELSSPETVIMFRDIVYIHHNILNLLMYSSVYNIDRVGRLKPSKYTYPIYVNKISQGDYMYIGQTINASTISFQDVSMVINTPYTIDILDVPYKVIYSLYGQNVIASYFKSIIIKGEPYKGLYAHLISRLSGKSASINIKLEKN